jgi:hypothetical protein
MRFRKERFLKTIIPRHLRTGEVCRLCRDKGSRQGKAGSAGKDGIGRDTSGGAVDSVAIMLSHRNKKGVRRLLFTFLRFSP